jgi:hypothetical protein
MKQQQAINIFSDPRGCGIVLVRPYCKEAVLALVGNTATISGLEQFLDTGNIDAYDKKWADANALVFADADWKTNPRETWLRAAGAMYAAYYVPDWDQYSLMEIVTYRQLVEFASSAAPYGDLLSEQDLKLGPKGVDPAGPARIAKYFVPALAAVFPPEPEPSVKLGAGPGADARLGVYAATAQEMFESPVLFLSPTARAFLEDVATRLGDDTLGRRFVSASGPDEWQTAVQDFQALEVAKIKSVSDRQKRAFIFGMTAAQAAYNAAVLREKVATDQQLAVLQQMSSALPSSVSAKVPAVVASAGDWHSLNQAAALLTLAVMEQ